MKATTVAELAVTEWASPTIFVPKKDKRFCFWVYYGCLNSVTERDSYPVPKVDECSDPLGEAQIYSPFHANTKYWQIETDGKDIDKTAFVTHHGLLKYTRKFFGQKNTPATFQLAMDGILETTKCQHALVYINDNILFFRTPKYYLKHIHEVLFLLIKDGVVVER